MTGSMRGSCANDLRRVKVRRSVTVYGSRRVVHLSIVDIDSYQRETSFAPLASQADVSDMAQEEVEAEIAKAVYQE